MKLKIRKVIVLLNTITTDWFNLLFLLTDIQQHGDFIKQIIILRSFLSLKSLILRKSTEFTFKAQEAKESGTKTSILVMY